MSDPISPAQRKKKKSPMDKLRSLLDDGSDIGLQSISGTVRLLLIHCEAAQREIDRLIAENDRWRHGADAVEALREIRDLDPDGDDFIGKLQNIIFAVHPTDLARAREGR